MKNKSKPVQRSMKHLRDNGWQVAQVERYLKAPGMKFGRRIDVWGFGDLLACRPQIYGDECEYCHGTGKRTSASGFVHVCDGGCFGKGKMSFADRAIALVQCCRDADMAAHRDKILKGTEDDPDIPEKARNWKAAGGKIFLQGWSLKGPRGEKKKWTLREEVL